MKIYISFLLLSCVETVSLLFIDAEQNNPAVPLGRHSEPFGYVNVLEYFPLPTEFYRNFVVNSKPFIIRNALKIHEFSAFGKWTDEYLSQKYGHLKVEVEQGKKDDRERPLKLMPFRDFLTVYKTEPIYLVTDLINEWRDDLTLPRTLQCGGFQNVIDKSVLWFSSGGTKSQLHKDEYDNINCILDGQKEIVLIDKIYQNSVEADHWVKEKGYSKVDVESVDATQFHKLLNLPWYSANIRKSDCIYIPSGWYHQVNSDSGRNLAINTWFRHLHWFNETNCHLKINLKPRPLSEYPATSLEYRIKYNLAQMHQREITRPMFLEKFAFQEFALFAIKEFFEFLDTDSNNQVSMKEVYSFDIVEMQKKFPYILDRYQVELFSEMISREDQLYPKTKDEMRDVFVSIQNMEKDVETPEEKEVPGYKTRTEAVKLFHSNAKKQNNENDVTTKTEL